MKRSAPRAPTREEAQLLERSSLFAALPGDALRELRANARVLVLGPGEPLWHQGEPAASIGLVIAGRCKWIREDSGKEVIVNVAIPGDLLGVVCLRRARVLLLPSLVVRQALQRNSLSLAALARFERLSASPRSSLRFGLTELH